MTSSVVDGQAIFERECMFFQLLSTIKEKTVGKMMQSAYLYVILYVEHKKIPFLGVLT